ncbi:Uncharacterized protein DAT39_017101, partial [Clarias magur]
LRARTRAESRTQQNAVALAQHYRSLMSPELQPTGTLHFHRHMLMEPKMAFYESLSCEKVYV